MASEYWNLTTGGPDYDAGSATLSNTPFTINLWYKPYSTAIGFGQLSIAGVGSGAAQGGQSARSRHVLSHDYNNNNLVYSAYANNSSFSTCTTTTTATYDAWNMATAVAVANNDRTVYLNGGGSATSTVTRAVQLPDRYVIGGYWIGDSIDGGGAVNEFEGAIAEYAIWNTNLTAAEIASLYTGVKATAIRPNNLVVYLPLTREHFDIKGNTTTLDIQYNYLDLFPDFTDNTVDGVVNHVRRYG